MIYNHLLTNSSLDARDGAPRNMFNNFIKGNLASFLTKLKTVISPNTDMSINAREIKSG